MDDVVILWMRKWRLREVKYTAGRHWAGLDPIFSHQFRAEFKELELGVSVCGEGRETSEDAVGMGTRSGIDTSIYTC